MARISTNNNVQLNPQNPTPQTPATATPNPAPGVKPINTNNQQASVNKWETFNETWGANTPLWDFMNKVWDTMWEAVGKPIMAGVQTYQDAKAGAEYLNQNKMENTAWGYNYTLDSTMWINEQGKLNALAWAGSLVGIPQTNNRLIPYNWKKATGSASRPTFEKSGVEHWVANAEQPAEEAAVQPEQAAETSGTVDNSAATNTPVVGGGTYTVTTDKNGNVVLKNADVNISQYWDDSSEKNYNNPELWWGENSKYTWEYTKNSQIWYDPNATLDNLDPNYKYWWDAQLANSESAWYIARRNDQIASALYNAWLTSITDVAEFLNNQPWFQNSNANERANTINSIWKRLGQMESENAQTQGAAAWTNNPADLSQMQSDLANKWGQLYGKVTADSNQPVETLADANSVFASMAESRLNTVKSLQSMDSTSIAVSIISWYTPGGDQGIRDLMQYDPAKYAEVQEAMKTIRGQMNINSITNGTDDYSTMVGSSNIESDKTDFAFNNSTSTTSAADILKSVNSTLSSNENASSAEETMAAIENDMAMLKNRLKNLKKEANSVFKGDVPQYIVNAYVSNRTAEIQNEMSVLEDRYNAAYTRYQNEWERTKWQAEFWLKQQELQLKKESMAWDQYMDKQGLTLKWADYNNTTNWTTPISTLSQAEAISTLQDFISTYTEWTSWGQCGTFVKRYLSQLGINLPGISSLASKVALVDPNITDPREWDVVIMDSKNYPENWHIAIVSSVDDDGTIHLLESNWNGDEKVHTTRTIKPGQKWVYGYYRPTGTTATWASSIFVKDGKFQRKDGETLDVTVSDILPTLTQAQQEAVFWLIDLRTDPSTITKRNYWDWFENIKAAALQIDPSWSEDKFKNKQKVKQEWNTSTKNGSNSRNWTAIATAKEIYELADEIGNANWKDWNSMVNFFKKKLSAEDFTRLSTKLDIMASEYAWALKWGNAAPTTPEIEEKKDLIATNLGSWAMKVAAAEMVRALYNKNANEAQNYKWETLEKPNLVVTKDVADRMYNELGFTDLWEYYNYTPWYWDLDIFINGGGSATAVYSAADILSA